MAVHQLLPNFVMGDAVSCHAMDIQEVLRERGIEAHIYAPQADAYGRHHGRPDAEYPEYMGREEDLLIFHYLIYCDNYEMYLESRNRKVLIYHNITPPEFYEEFDPVTEGFCRMGRDLLPRLAGCDLALGDSDFNRRELVQAGFPEERTGVLPISPVFGRFAGAPLDRQLERRLSDGRLNLLFVGRVVPNKRVEDLLRLVRQYGSVVNAAVRLVVVGALNSYVYADNVLGLADQLGLDEQVLFLGKVGDAALKTCYACSHFYLSMSEHEGFCVPLLEAFDFDLPVLAYAAGAVPETMGEAGVLFEEKDFPLLAELLDSLRRDPLKRQRITAAQRERLRRFDRESFLARFDETIGTLLEGAGA